MELLRWSGVILNEMANDVATMANLNDMLNAYFSLLDDPQKLTDLTDFIISQFVGSEALQIPKCVCTQMYVFSVSFL